MSTQKGSVAAASYSCVRGFYFVCICNTYIYWLYIHIYIYIYMFTSTRFALQWCVMHPSQWVQVKTQDNERTINEIFLFWAPELLLGMQEPKWAQLLPFHLCRSDRLRWDLASEWPWRGWMHLEEYAPTGFPEDVATFQVVRRYCSLRLLH